MKTAIPFQNIISERWYDFIRLLYPLGGENERLVGGIGSCDIKALTTLLSCDEFHFLN